MKPVFLFLATLFQVLCFAQITPEWTTVFNNCYGAGKIKADNFGNVFVSGSGISPNTSNNAQDYLLIKYNGSGTQEWVQYYNGNGNWEDYIFALTTDDTGNVYVTGASDEGPTGLDMTTIKYNPGGQLVWKSHYRGTKLDRDDIGNAIAVDRFGNVFVTGSSKPESGWEDFVTIKYNADGDTLWTRRDGGGLLQKPTDLVVDYFGNAYVTGYMDFGTERFNYVTIKYSPEGEVLWAKAYNGTASDDDVPSGIVIDDLYNVYVTGKSWGTFYDDYATIKYDSSGNQLWVKRYNGPVNSHDKATGIALDNSGNIYVTGSSGGTGVNYDYTTIKYNPAGQELWVKRYNGPANKNDYALALVVDNNANIYVTGYSENAPEPFISSTDYLTVMYDSSGNEKWFHRYNGPGNYHDQARSITIDNSGNVAITGKCQIYGQSTSDISTIKYSNPNSLVDFNTLSEISVFPNPSSDKIFFQTKYGCKSLSVFNLMGKLVLSEEYDINEPDNNSLDVSKLPGGAYLVKLETNEEMCIAKFVKY